MDREFPVEKERDTFIIRICKSDIVNIIDNPLFISDPVCPSKDSYSIEVKDNSPISVLKVINKETKETFDGALITPRRIDEIRKADERVFNFGLL